MINKTTFGAFIREKRTEKGLTQKELATELFLSESAVSKWEMGKSFPDITLIPDLCRVLDVSEHELIGGANDTEYRRMKKEARLYRKISETFFRGFTAAYIAAFVITFLCDICINKKPTCSFIVFSSLLTAFTFIPSAVRFTEKHKLALFAGSTFLALSLLFITCCVYNRENWFLTAETGTLLGYAVLFGYPILKKYMPETKRKYIPLIWFPACFICVLLLIFAVRLTVPFRTASGVLCALYGFIPFAGAMLLHLLPCRRTLKAAADVLLFSLTAYGSQYIINKIMGIDTSADYAVNFADWQTCANGNVYLLILIAGLTVAAVLVITALRKKDILR